MESNSDRVNRLFQLENKLRNLVEDNNIEGVKEFMSKYEEDICIGSVMHHIKTYDMFLAVIGDILIDQNALVEIMDGVGINTRIIDYLLIYGISPTDIICTYICRDFAETYDMYRENCDHECDSNDEECIMCLEETQEYNVIVGMISKSGVDIDEIRKKCIYNNELLHLILNNLPVDV